VARRALRIPPGRGQRPDPLRANGFGVVRTGIAQAANDNRPPALGGWRRWMVLIAVFAVVAGVRLALSP